MEITVSRRSETGKGASRQYRRQGKIPGIVYGKKKETVPILIEDKVLKGYIKEHGISRVLTLSLDEKKHEVLFKNISRDIYTRKIIHIDFHEIDQAKEVVRTVELNFIGTPVAVSIGEGILMTLNRTIEISCLPGNIPEKPIDVNVESLNLHDSLHVSDIQLPPELKLVSLATIPIVSVTVMKEEEVVAAETPEGEEATEGGKTPEEEDKSKGPEIVDKKGKKETDESTLSKK